MGDLAVIFYGKGCVGTCMAQRLLKIPERNSVFLLGPRGTGKATLVCDSLAHLKSSKTLWIDLLQPEQEEELQRNPGHLRERIVATNAVTVVINDVQTVPALLDIAHELIESKGIRFILTGFSARKLKRGGANLLAGRALDRGSKGIQRRIFKDSNSQTHSRFNEQI